VPEVPEDDLLRAQAAVRAVAARLHGMRVLLRRGVSEGEAMTESEQAEYLSAYIDLLNSDSIRSSRG
jgi:hypothetical protein